MSIDIIIIILALAFSIISAITKRAKNKSRLQDTAHKPAAPVAQADDPWQTSTQSGRPQKSKLEEILEMLGGGGEEPYFPPQMSTAGIETQSEVAPSEQSDKGVIEKAERVYKRKESFSPNRFVKEEVFNPITDIAPDDSTLIESMELLKDFDLTEAVVYSEILKPKFKEY